MDNTTYKYASIYAPTDYSSPLVSNSNNGKGMAFLDFLGIGESFLNGLFGHYENNRNMHFQEDMQKAQMDFANEQRELTQQYNTSEREATQDFNLQMYNLNNAYNSPQAQMQRAMQAGINPNSFAQSINGGQSQSVTSSPQSVGMPGMPGMGSGALGHTQLIDPALVNANKLAQSQVDLNEAQASALTVNAEANARQAGVAEENLKLNKKQLDAVINQMDKQNQLIDQNLKIGIEEEKSKALQNAYQDFYNNTLLPLIEEQNIKQIEALKQNISESKARVAEIGAQIKNINQQIAESKKRMEGIQSEVDKNAAETELVKLQKVRQQLENEAKGINNDISRQLGYDVEKLNASQVGVMGFMRLFDNISTSIKRAGQFMSGKGHLPSQVRDAYSSTPNRFDNYYGGNSFTGAYNPF
jgi:hypothetical protein